MFPAPNKKLHENANKEDKPKTTKQQRIYYII